MFSFEFSNDRSFFVLFLSPALCLDEREGVPSAVTIMFLSFKSIKFLSRSLGFSYHILLVV